jgi:hypothetical protein
MEEDDPNPSKKSHLKSRIHSLRNFSENYYYYYYYYYFFHFQNSSCIWLDSFKMRRNLKSQIQIEIITYQRPYSYQLNYIIYLDIRVNMSELHWSP